MCMNETYYYTMLRFNRSSWLKHKTLTYGLTTVMNASGDVHYKENKKSPYECTNFFYSYLMINKLVTRVKIEFIIEIFLSIFLFIIFKT